MHSMNYISTISLIIFFSVVISFIPMSPVSAQTMAQRLSGRIVLQVENHGEAWYVDPVTLRRYYLGRPHDAFSIMREKGLGIRHHELQQYLSSIFPSRLSGRIMLDVEKNGEAYYVDPLTRKAPYLGRPHDAFEIMRSYGLGISNKDLALIPIASDSKFVPSSVEMQASPVEAQAFEAINAHRTSKGLSPLVWNDSVAEQAKIHSQNMANGTTAFGHDGFATRINILKETITITEAGENVAYNSHQNPVQKAVEGWLASPGHKANIENATYNQTGIGIVQDANGKYYLTQKFIHTPLSTHSYESSVIATQAGNFNTHVVRLPIDQFEMVTESATASDCTNCPALSLATYVQEHDGLVGIHGTYFCPPDYGACVNKKYSFDSPLRKTSTGTWLNTAGIDWFHRPFIAINADDQPFYIQKLSEYPGSLDTIKSGIGNWPSLVENKNVVIHNQPQEASFGTKATRAGIGWSNDEYLLVVATGASVSDLAYIFHALDADYAMNLDGGGSTALYYEGSYKVGPGRQLPNAIIFRQK